MTLRALTLLLSLAVCAACGNQSQRHADAGRHDAGRRVNPRAVPTKGTGIRTSPDRETTRPLVVRLTTESAPDATTRALVIATSSTGLAGPFRDVGAWDGVSDPGSMMPTPTPDVPVAIATQGPVRAAELERVMAALYGRGVHEVSVHAPDERPVTVAIDMRELDFLFGFNVLLRAADARWTSWTAGGMQAMWILDVGPSATADEAFALGEQIRLRRPQRVIIVHGGGRAGVQGWVRRVRVACQTARTIDAECFVAREPVLDNGAPEAPSTARMMATVSVTSGGPSVADIVRTLGGTPGTSATAPVELPALQTCAYRPESATTSARLSATLTVDAQGFARDLEGNPQPHPMRCVADKLARRTYPAASAQYRITIRAELTEPGHAVPRLIDRQRRQRGGADGSATATP